MSGRAKAPASKALFLFPTKALAQAQVAELLELNRAGQLGVKAFTFEGDTPGDARQPIRLPATIVFSHPDMLHKAILTHNTQCPPLFETLPHTVNNTLHHYPNQS